MNTKIINVEISSDAVTLIDREAKENIRTRKAQLKVILEKHAEALERKYSIKDAIAEKVETAEATQ
jgi:hypothetical protein